MIPKATLNSWWKQPLQCSIPFTKGADFVLQKNTHTHLNKRTNTATKIHHRSKHWVCRIGQSLHNNPNRPAGKTLNSRRANADLEKLHNIHSYSVCFLLSETKSRLGRAHKHAPMSMHPFKSISEFTLVILHKTKRVGANPVCYRSALLQSVYSGVWKRDWVPSRAHLRERGRGRESCLMFFSHSKKEETGKHWSRFQLNQRALPGNTRSFLKIWWKEDNKNRPRCKRLNARHAWIMNCIWFKIKAAKLNKTNFQKLPVFALNCLLH